MHPLKEAFGTHRKQVSSLPYLDGEPWYSRINAGIISVRLLDVQWDYTVRVPILSKAMH